MALLQLRGAKNLRTVTIGSSAALTVGASVTAVGNSGGFGRLISARGTVLRLGRSVTVENEIGERHRLSGLIETDAALRPGDSGGPLVNTQGVVIGMDAAATTSRRGRTTNDSFAIPINTALDVAHQIDDRREDVDEHGRVVAAGCRQPPGQTEK